jgi:hypothetical protein
MNDRRTDALIEAIAADARPVRPLAPPLARALTLLVPLALLGGLAIYLFADLSGLIRRYPGRESMMMLEMAAMLATGLIAVTGAFFLSVPGRSRLWLWAPLPTLAAWVSLSGAGCWMTFRRGTPAGSEPGMDCLIFILAASLLLGAPLVWRLSRASPIEPVRVALLGGLGIAALSAFLLQFFHPFTITFLDLGVHFVAVAIVIAAMALAARRTLRPG